MRRTLFILAATLLGLQTTEAMAQQKSRNLVITAPATATLNRSGYVDVTISATLTDSWTSRNLPGYLIAFGIGEEFYLSPSGPYNTNANGAVSFKWRFNSRGRYRIVAYADYQNPYLSERSLKFIDIR